ncbi:MAG: family lipolytic protein, partial [Clostridiales bacterium]|nr:family lipolytic protein [Clostridiales bacterium]
MRKIIVNKKLTAKFLSAFMAANLFAGAVNGNGIMASAAEDTPLYKFDFGDGPLKSGYTQVQSTTAYSESAKYGFSEVSKVSSGSTTDTDSLKADYLISDGTTFNVDLQPGDYKVNVIFGDTASATTVDVGVERQFGKDYNGADTYLLNMIKLSAAQAAAGEFLERSFTVSLIDNQLNLDFIGTAAKINGLEIYKLPERAAGTVPTVYLASDSTVQTYDSYWKPQAGWGQMVNKFFTDDVNIDNRAIGGRSSRSFISEGRLDVILSEIKPGDYLLLQWGHNDATYSRPERYVSEADFPTYIKMYIDGVRQRGATPVLVTPVARRSFDPATGIFNISFGGYRQKMMELSQSMNVPLIDLGLKSKLFLDNFGAEGSKSIFLHVPAGIYGAFPNGSADDTHYQEFGAIQMARLVSEGVKELNLGIAQFVKDIEPPAEVPAAPQNLTSGKIGSSTIAMSWAAVEGADIYYIYRQKQGDSEFSKAGTSTITQFTDVNAAQETTYSYRVVAVNGKGESLPSNTITATTKAPGFRFDFGVPGSPVQEGFIEIPYNLEYTVERGYGLSPAVGNGRDRGVVTGYNDMQRDFILGTTEFKLDVPNGDYTVKITVGDGIGTAKNVLSAEGKGLGTFTTKLGEKLVDVRVADGQLNIGSDGWLNGIEVTAILLAPTGLRSYEKILGENPSVVLAWNPVEDAASYNIYRKSDTDLDFVKIGNVSADEETKFYEQTANLGSKYLYKVTALTSDGYESGESNIEEVVMIDPNAPLPAAPTGLAVSAISKNSVTIGWSAVAEAVVYNVYRAKSENGTYSKIGDTKELQYTDNTVTTNVHYYYKLQAVSAGGPSELSQFLRTDVAVSLQRQMENLTDRALRATKTENGVYLSWRSLINDPQDMAFNIYRDGQRINFAPVANSTNYLDAAGTLDSTYNVKAVINDVEQATGNTVNVLANNYFDIRLNKPENGFTPLGEQYTYHPNDASVGDLDGDGEYELVVKWQPDRAKDNSHSGYTGETILDAYEMDGTQLWRINLGKNIRSGAHY